ncbi:glycosyltransferase family 31 protein [Amniculicola lignicola CBS 123094]|uniref:Glycosyltransferase family 31 protein n=1 Tax=Amniculicola lignicola CBS 123094 TaxID=1392246 RepID=A0A6A5WCS5_9PLEO|nr:glycosyltransferase family 31 protein [Amniculicola lignicola CBS 123094]
MPILTPSRIAVVVLTLSLLSFLWTFGLPHQPPTPSFPIINHDDHKDATKTADNFERPDFSFGPEQGIGAKTSLSEELKSIHLPIPTSTTANDIDEGTGEDGNNGGKKEEETQKSEATPLPSGLYTNATTTTISASPAAQTKPPLPVKFCKEVHGAENVMIIVKTSKAELDKKLPTHLKTLLSCVPNFAIFSDHSGEIEGFPVYDALSDISNKTKDTHKEFNEYVHMQHYPDLKVDKVDKELDKWKMLPMVYKAYMMRPHSRWYIFIEADTSLSWTNTLQWTNRLDYRIPYYSGAPTFMGSTKFAQRGSGIMLSYGALKQYAKGYDERYEEEWEKRVGKECCGDLVLATALADSRVEFYNSFPMLQGETPTTLDWTDKQWCTPIVSWHHMSQDEITRVWDVHRNWTTKHGWDVPYMGRNAFEEFVLPHLEETKDEWDNISSDSKIKPPDRPPPEAEEKPKPKTENKDPSEPNTDAGPKDTPAPEPNGKPPSAHTPRDSINFSKLSSVVDVAADSATQCRALCLSVEDCLQWKFYTKNSAGLNNECHLGKVIRLGRHDGLGKGEVEMWTSGWMMERINRKRLEWGECEEVRWKFNQ